MISVSVSDLLITEELKHLNSEANMVLLSNDKEVSKSLYELGLDYNKGYRVEAAKHRNLQGKCVIGFRYVGEIRTDKEFRYSPFCTLVDKICMNHTTNLSLAEEMLSMLRVTSGVYGGSYTSEDELPPEAYEEDYEDVRQQLAALNAYAKSVRGYEYDERGNVKNLQAWLETK